MGKRVIVLNTMTNLHCPKSKDRVMPKYKPALLSGGEKQRIIQAIQNGDMGGIIKGDEILTRKIWNLTVTKIYEE
jgi:ABC-type glutathione transport system ATPase component